MFALKNNKPKSVLPRNILSPVAVTCMKLSGDIPVFTRLNWGIACLNITPQTLTPPSRGRSALWTQATTKAPSSGAHTASLSRQRGQWPRPHQLHRSKISPHYRRGSVHLQSHIVLNTVTHAHILAWRALTAQPRPCLHTQAACLREISGHKSELSM